MDLEVSVLSGRSRAVRELSFLVESSLTQLRNVTELTGTQNSTQPSIPLEFLTMSERSRLVVSLYALIFLLSASLNLSVFVSVCRKLLRDGVKTRLTLLILHLSVADLIVTFFFIPMEVFWRVSVSWIGGNVLCKACMFLRAFGLYLSSMVIICISLDRYLAVLHPLRVLGGRRKLSTMLLVAWVAAALCSAPQSLIFSVKQHPDFVWFENCVTIGYFSSREQEVLYNVFSISAMYFLPLLVILYTYSAILWTISRKTRENQQVLEVVTYSLRQQQERRALPQAEVSPALGASGVETHPNPSGVNPDESRVLSSHLTGEPATRVLALRRSGNGICAITRARTRTLRLTIVIVLTFLLCSTPYVFITLWYMFDWDTAERVDGHLQDGLFMMCVANSVLNPLIYGTYRKGKACERFCVKVKTKDRKASCSSSTTTVTSRGSVVSSRHLELRTSGPRLTPPKWSHNRDRDRSLSRPSTHYSHIT